MRPSFSSMSCSARTRRAFALRPGSSSLKVVSSAASFLDTGKFVPTK